ncbi:transketolase [Microlunatus endophyticus]|uniref:Transketolase n=1 Tax=Microlunatus endophyticus TaxID=1716077 RepID=A0A917S3D8_9ACTN|nr:transketolase [Microlunatus endophyticus]GGL55603.1 transketolase [Microlunatus endophyticus]
MKSRTTSGYGELGRLMGLLTGDEKHGPSATSTLDVIWVLYDRILSITPATVDDPARDRFVLSKGHGPIAYYAVLAAKGFLGEDQLAGLASYDSRLGHHPDRLLVPGVEFSSGSLGHGLPASVGMAHGLLVRGIGARVICLIGDAEFDEGSNSEAVVYAGGIGLANLTAVVIDNQSSSHGWSGGIGRRFAVEGWLVHEIDGRDHEAIAAAFLSTAPDAPTAVVARVEPKG